MATHLFKILFLCIGFVSTESDTNRRILHEPLFPIQWTPPPPPGSADPFPETPTPPSQFFPDPPPSQAGNIQTPNLPMSSHPIPSSKSSKSVVVAVSVSVSVAILLALVALSGFFLYRRRIKRAPPDTRKLIGGENGERLRFQPPPAPEFLYLGTMEPTERRRVSESNESPYRKLSSDRSLEAHLPSPELQPLPALIGPASVRRAPPPPPPAASLTTAPSDDDGFYTPNRSVASLTSDSPSSPLSLSRRSLPGSIGRKEIVVPPIEHNPRSRRTSPRMQFPNSSPTQIKHPVPPPPPPPPPIYSTEAPVLKTASRTSSRRQLLRPLPVEATRIGIPLPPSRLSNGSSGSSSQLGEETGDDLDGDSKPKLKPLHWDKVRASSERATVWDQLKSSSFQ